jgi:thiamine-phosphate pyrophosphorylase
MIQIDKNIMNLQFVTDSPDCQGTVAQALAAVEGGCRWVQVRMKHADDDAVRSVLEVLCPVFKDIGATLIVDDRVMLALETDVDGVHLGREDMSPLEARALLGDDKIVGMTVNNIEDVYRAKDMPVDYIGMGPWRFTTTKQKLAEVLGAEGIKALVTELRKLGVNVPVVAIGGITADDIGAVLDTGAEGVAVSGAISHQSDMVAATARLLHEIEYYKTKNI